MNWLNDLDKENPLYALADECLEHVVESYYLIFSDKPQELPED